MRVRETHLWHGERLGGGPGPGSPSNPKRFDLSNRLRNPQAKQGQEEVSLFYKVWVNWSWRFVSDVVELGNMT